MAEVKRICKFCGKEYTYCNHCGDDSKKPMWKYLTDTIECLDAFYILTDYSSEELTKEEAKNKLIECGVNIDLASKENKPLIDKIFEEPKKVEQVVQPKVQNYVNKKKDR